MINSLVVYCKNNVDDLNAANFMQNLRGVVSNAVPHQGSELAALAMRANCCLPLRLSKFVCPLKLFDEENERLSEQFRVAIQNRALEVRE